MSEIFLAFRPKLLCGVVKTAFSLSIATLCGKNFFCQKCFCPNFFGHLAKNLSFLFETFSVNLTKLHSTCPKDQFEGITLFWRCLCLFFSCSQEIQWRNIGFFGQKTIDKFVTTAYHVSKKNFWRIFFSKISFSIIGHWATFVCWKIVGPVVSTGFYLSIRPVCGEKTFVIDFFLPSILDTDRKLISHGSNFFWAKLTTLHSTSPRDQFVDIKPFWKVFVCFIYQLQTLSKNNKAFFRKTNCRVVKTAYHVSKVICWRIFFGKSSFFYFIIGHWASFFCHFDKLLLVGLSVLLSVSQLHQFMVKFFLSKTFFSHHFWTLIANLLVFVQSFFGTVDETVFHESEGSIWGQTSVLENFCKFFHSSWALNEKLTAFPVAKLLAVSPKLLTTCQGDLLKRFFLNMCLFCSSLTLERNFSGISTKTSLWCCQNCFQSVHCNTLWKKFFLSKMFLPQLFRSFSKKFVISFRNFFGQLDKTAFHVSKGSIWGHNSILTMSLFVLFMFSRNSMEKYWFFWSKNDRQICHNCLPRVQEEFLKNFFFKNFFFHHWALSDFCLLKDCWSRCQYWFLFVN